MNKDSLLASDMDGTVIPLDRRDSRTQEIEQFNRLIAGHENLALAYVTGRHLELGLAGVEQHGLPVPDIMVCDVGTSIYFRDNNEWRQDEAYSSELRDSWNGLTGPDIARVLADVPMLTVQEEERQKEFKQSYYASVAEDPARIVATTQERLAQNGIEANVIYSVGTMGDIALVDVLPTIAAKDYALEYLWRSLGLEKDRIVYAGDSGNDLLAFVSGFNAIVVENTAEAVKEEVRRQAKEKDIADKIFFAPSKFVAGVMEGCFHFKLFT